MATLTDGGDSKILDCCARALGYAAVAVGVSAFLKLQLLCFLSENSTCVLFPLLFSYLIHIYCNNNHLHRFMNKNKEAAEKKKFLKILPKIGSQFFSPPQNHKGTRHVYATPTHQMDH